MTRKKIILIIIAIAVPVILLGTGVWYFFIKASPPKPVATTEPAKPEEKKQEPVTSTPPAAATPTPAPTPTPPASGWPVQLTMAEAASLTVDVNKKHKLPDAYVPAGLTAFKGFQLRSEAAIALTELINAAQAKGLAIKLVSGYRSFASQTAVYNNYVAIDGQAAADTYSARPGFSEHQTGLAADVGNINGECELISCFGNTDAGMWVAANAQNYGFIVRYPKGKEAETGYQYEPWHLRYLGIDTAKAIYASGKTMDQFYGVTAGGYN